MQTDQGALAAGDPDILYAPDPEQIATTNAWAFLHWLRATGAARLAGWDALRDFSAADPAGFAAAVARFARLPDAPLRLGRHGGDKPALVVREVAGARRVLSADALGAPPPSTPAPIAALLARDWPPAALIRPLADVLLFADLRPDDRVLLAGVAPWPWLAALLDGTTLVLAPGAPATLLDDAEAESATVIVAQAPVLAEAAFRRPRRRPDLRALRQIVAVGGPLAPEARTRVHTWIKPDVMLLAWAGETVWGNPMAPVRARPPAAPGLFRPRPSDPAPG